MAFLPPLMPFSPLVLHGRSHVISMLPRLKTLDSRPVVDEERVQALYTVQQESARVAVMLSNACTVHKMVGRIYLSLFLRMSMMCSTLLF